MTSPEKGNLHSRVHVMIGGAPIIEAYAKEIGADEYGAMLPLLSPLRRRSSRSSSLLSQ